MYDPAKIPEPPAQPSTLKDFPYAARTTGRNPDIFMAGQPTAQQGREAIAAYYACVSFVDDNVGRVLDALDQQGLADNTIVFVLGDHGFHLGDHAMWSKYSMLEATRRAPLWVRVPGAPANGKVCREFVEFVDFVPTLGELLGLDLPANLEGTSFAPLLATPERPWKKAVFQVQAPGEQMVRNRRYSYMEFKNGPVPVALYDLEKDPWETINLANDPAHATTRGEMAAMLQAGWKAARPEGVQ
jgi:arylsulfatase A-like enzyme